MMSFLKSFGYAFQGLKTAWRERNFKFQVLIAFMVLIFGLVLGLTPMEWSVVFILCAMVLGLELINSAIERYCNLISMEFNPIIKEIKDISAGAVLLVSVFSAIIGIIIFLPKIIRFIN